jgi:FMN phosphatase YigB (HAD superfamily)
MAGMAVPADPDPGSPTAGLRALVMDYGGVLTEGAPMLSLPHRARKAGLATALVSDAHAVPEAVARLFDVVVLGGALGVRKPDPEVFRRVAGLLKVAPTECVVVDDLARNVRGATAAGAVGVLHRAVSLTVEEVEILLDLP